MVSLAGEHISTGFNYGDISMMGVFDIGRGRGGEKILQNVGFGERQRGLGGLGVFAHLVNMAVLCCG